MLLLDAYNILHTRGILPPRLAGLEIPGLIHLIGRSRYAGRGLRLVCDGRRPPTDKASAMRSGEERVTLGPAEIWYAGEGKDADGLIEQILRMDSAARRMVVVSSDRRVQRAASRARAEFIGSETFLMHLVRDEEAPRRSALPEFVTAVPLDGYAVAHWIREFGVGEDWLGIRSSAPLPGNSTGTPTPAGGAAGAPSDLGIRDGLAASAGRGVPADAASGQDAAQRAAVPKSELEADPPEWVREAMRLWGDRLRLDDLDMQKWLKT
ncbi:MAG: NYN domain-containing protein [Phycisphaerales bacterium]|nr:NYN domain-containing protein [Phycisphaerales bacterium]